MSNRRKHRNYRLNRAALYQGDRPARCRVSELERVRQEAIDNETAHKDWVWSLHKQWDAEHEAEMNPPEPTTEPITSTALVVVEPARPTQLMVTTAPQYSREANRAKIEEFERRKVEAMEPMEKWYASLKLESDPISAS